jgi:dihydroorotate dehydrogenase (NAD+) catalytic subunit
VKFLLCGATAVQVGTASYLNPMAAGEVAAGIEAWCREQGVAAVRDVVGSLALPGPGPGPAPGRPGAG